MNLPITLKLLRHLEELRRHERWTRPQLEVYQAEALRRQRTYAYVHSPFYQRFHKGLTDRPLHELPVLTKALMMEQFNDLVTDRAVRLETVREYTAKNVGDKRYLGRYWVTATSGSSGQPGFFLFNQSEWVMIMVSFARAQEWSGVKINLLRRRKMATIASISPWHMSSQVSQTAKSWWMPSIRIAASEPLANIVQQLNQWQPELLVAYASMARILAEEQLAGRLHIRPQKVYTSSEVLTDETRRRVKLAWGSEPYNQYASTETASIAAECEEGRRMHLFEDLVIIEVVDEQHRPVPPGEYGAKVLITTLFSRTQPLIRYELNDSVRLAADPGSSRVPFARIDGIQGRTEDILRLPGRSGEEVAVHPVTFHHVLDVLPVNGWQVVQELDGLRVLLSGTPKGVNNSMLVDALTRSLAAQNVVVPSISVQHVDTIPKNATGKAPLIKAYRPS